MKDPRNPFRLRASEHIENDTTFLKFFEPGMLDLLPKSDANKKVHIIRSAAGGGKTSLLRLFSPAALLALHAGKGRDDLRELFARLQEMGFIDGTGPQLLSVNISFSQEYAALTDIGVDDARMARLLWGLLNARVVLGALRGAMLLSRLEYPRDVERLTISAEPSTTDQFGFRFPCHGGVLYSWARQLESDVCEALGGFKPDFDGSALHRGLIALEIIRPGAISLDGAPVAQQALVTFDNGQDIAPKQRTALLRHLLNLRSPVGVWFAERFEAMSTDELLTSGVLAGRDYHPVITLETFWRKSKPKLQKMLFSIADRRSREASADVTSFASCIESSLDGSKEEVKVSKALDQVQLRVRANTRNQSSYESWIEEREGLEASPWDRLVAWRTLEILIDRDKRKAQKSLDFVDLTIKELQDQDGSDVQSAAKLFLAKEFSLPYYYGPDCLASLASANIEQYLWLAGDLFEEVAAAHVLKRPLQLSPSRQDSILRDAIKSWWDEIPRRMRNGREIMKFLNAIGEFSRDITYQPNAPYSPGVTGIAISMKEFELLRSVDSSSDANGELRRVLSIAISHNLLEANPNYKVKNDEYMVLYLNRALCVQFRLPWKYGGFRERKLRELRSWLATGYKSPKGQLL